MVFALVGCQDAPRSAGGGGIDVPGVEMAFCGSTGDKLVFVVLPTFDWINGGGIGSGSGSGSGVGPGGAHWHGYHQDEKNHRWNWEVRDGSARFGQQEFALADGEVFIMHCDFSIVQLPDSKAGSRADETNLQRLSDLFKQSISESGPRD